MEFNAFDDCGFYCVFRIEAFVGYGCFCGYDGFFGGFYGVYSFYGCDGFYGFCGC